MMPRLATKNIPTLAAFAVLIILYAACAIRYDFFRDYDTFRNILIGASIVGIAAIGMTFVIISGGIDLSVGAIIGFTSILIGVLVTSGVHPYLTWAIAIAIATLGGACSGAIIHVFKLPPFIVTLGAMFFFRGCALLVSAESQPIDHRIYDRLGILGIGNFPPLIILFLTVALAGWFVSRSTRFGRTTYAIGGRETSARLMGLPVASTKIRVYALSGACAAIAGIATTMNTPTGYAKAGEFAELDAIAGVVIGGTPLSGGIGSIPGTVAGVLITSLIQELIIFFGVPNSWWVKIAIGALLLTFILLQRLIQSRAERLTQSDRA
jgi:simple sugar transport system permease protein